MGNCTGIMAKRQFAGLPLWLRDRQKFLHHSDRFKEGGGAYYGLPKAATFELVEGKKYYEVKGFAGLFRLTQLSSTKK